MQLQYELRLEMYSIDRVPGSETSGKVLDTSKNVFTMKTETLDMALLPLLTKNPAHYHPVSASKDNLNYYIPKAFVYKIGDPKPIAALVKYDTVEKKGHQPTDEQAEIMYVIKGKFDGASDRLKNIYKTFLQPEGNSGIPVGRYSHPKSTMRLADELTFEPATALLRNTLKNGNFFDVFKWEEIPINKVPGGDGLFLETVSRIEGLMPAVAALLSSRLTEEGLYRHPDPSRVRVHDFLERASDQTMIMCIQTQNYLNEEKWCKPGLYLTFPKASATADLVKRTPQLAKIIKDPWSYTPVAVSDTLFFSDIKALPEVMKLLKPKHTSTLKVEPISKKQLHTAITESKKGFRL